MGTRVIHQIRDFDNIVVATLFSNCSHAFVTAEARFDAALADANIKGPSALLERLLSERYPTAEGVHSAGDRMFHLVPESEAADGHRERVITATPVAHKVKDRTISTFDLPPTMKWVRNVEKFA